MRAIDADVLKRHIDKLPALPDGNFAGNHSALKALINMQPTIEPSANNSEIPNSYDTISRQAAIDAAIEAVDSWDGGCNIGRQKRIENYINSLPSAQPKRGKWQYHSYIPHNKYCPKCKKDSPYNKRWDFCPNCGAEMREVTT